MSDIKFTEYFRYTRQRPDRIGIKMEWIEQVVLSPDAETMQADGRIRRWSKIAEADWKTP